MLQILSTSPDKQDCKTVQFFCQTDISDHCACNIVRLPRASGLTLCSVRTAEHTLFWPAALCASSPQPVSSTALSTW